MSALTAQLEQLKKQQEELEKRIQEEEETNKKLNNDASIERLEVLVKPLTNMLDHRSSHGMNGGVPIWEKSARMECQKHYENELYLYNMGLLTQPPDLRECRLPPQKSKDLWKEEIYTTIISIFKKQDERIKILESKLGKDI